LFYKARTRVEVSTTNLEKSVSGLRAASNVSILVRAFNEQGISPPSLQVFCSTHDTRKMKSIYPRNNKLEDILNQSNVFYITVPSAPRRLRGVSTSVSSVLVAWDRPNQYHGNLLHYTIYSHARGEAIQHDLVAAGSIDATWRELTSLLTATPVQVFTN